MRSGIHPLAARREGRYPEIVQDDPETLVPFGVFRPEERRAMIGCAFAAGCICVMPREMAGAAISFALAGLLGLWHLLALRRERVAADGRSEGPR